MVSCAVVGLGMGFGSRAASRADVARAKVEAKQVTVRFLNALDRRHYDQACSLLAHLFYRHNHVRGRKQCVIGFSVGMAGTRVQFHITRVDAATDKAKVHGVVDGEPGTVLLVREPPGFRVLDLQGA